MGYSAKSSGIYQSWTPVFTGVGSQPAINIARYVLDGKMCTLYILTSSVTSNSTAKTFTLPFPAKYTHIHRGMYQLNNGTADTGVGRIDTAQSSTTASIYRDGNGLAWTASGNFNVRINMVYEIE